MKKLIKNILTKSKYNFVLVIAALLMLAVSLSAVTYCWIETTNDILIRNSNVTDETITAKTDTNGTVNITVGSTGAVSLNRYIDNIDNLFLAPAKMNGTTLQILRDSGSYTNATTNDIGNNYIEFDVPFKVDLRSSFSFTADSKITVDGAASNPVRLSVSVDGGTAKVFDSTLNNVDSTVEEAEKRVAFYAGSSTVHTMKVRIWLDTSDPTYLNYEGKTVGINLGLVPAKDESAASVLVKSSTYAKVTATYVVDGIENTIPLDSKYSVDPGTKITLKAVTGTTDGKLITTGDNMILNGHTFSSFSAKDINGVSSTVSGAASSAVDNLLTTTATFTVPAEGSSDYEISTLTDVVTFRIGGINMKTKSGSSYNTYTAWGNSNYIEMTYNKELNCVYSVMQITKAGGSSGSLFKVASGKSFEGTYRDSSTYSVPPNITDKASQLISGGDITGLNIYEDSQGSYYNCFQFTSPLNTDVLVIYYLDTNRVELNTNTSLQETFTATVANSTANGTATVNAGTSYNAASAGETAVIKRSLVDRSVTFHAEAADGYKFVGWSTTKGGTTYVSTDADYTTAISADTTLYANYMKACTVTVTNATAVYYRDGSATSESVTFTNGKATVLEGSSLDFTVTLPDATNAYKVTWYINGTAQTPVKYIKPGQTTDKTWLIENITDNVTVEARIERLYKLTISPTGGTVASVTNAAIALSGNTAYFESGASTTITATSSDTGYYKVNWSGSGTSGTKETDLTADNTTKKTDSFDIASITADTTVTVTFTQLYKITVSVDEDSIKNTNVISKVNGMILVTIYQPSGTVIDMTASNSNYSNDEITADWTITYGNGTSKTDLSTLTHSETINSSTGDVTVTVLVKEKPSIPECAQTILKGTKVSFYAGYTTNWSESSVINLNKNSTTKTASVAKADFMTKTINSANYYVGSFVELDSLQYYISNKEPSAWTGNQINEVAQGGKFYGAYWNGVEGNANEIKTVSATTGTTTVSPTSVNLNSTDNITLSTTVSSLKSSVGTDLYLQYYALNISTGDYDLIYSSKALTSTSNSVTKDLSSYFTIAGNLTIKTVLSDGTVYYVADTDTIKVVDPNAQTITVNQSSTNTILFVDDSKITISKANYIHAWVNGGEIITNTNDNSRTPLDSFTGNSFKYKNFDTFSSAWQSTASGKNIYFKLMVNNKWDNNDGYKAVENSTLQMGKQIYTASANSYSAFTPLCISSITRSGALTNGNTISMSLTASGGTPWYFYTQRSSSEAAKYKLTVTDKVGSTTTTVISGQEFTYSTDSRTVDFTWKPTATGTHTLTFTLTTNDGADSVTYTNSSNFVIS